MTAAHKSCPDRRTFESLRDVPDRRQANKRCDPGQVTDSSITPPRPRPLQRDSERGRGLHIVASLATDSGVTTSPHGKTAWFTITQHPSANLQPDLEAEAGA